MIYVNSIANALYTQIASDTFIVGSGINVQLEEEFNSDDRKEFWVGVYHENTTLEPKRSNMHKPWLAQVNFEVYAQGLGYNTRGGMIDKANSITQMVMSAVNCSKQFDIGGVVYTLRFNGFEPFKAVREGSGALWTNGISLFYELLA